MHEWGNELRARKGKVFIHRRLKTQVPFQKVVFSGTWYSERHSFQYNCIFQLQVIYC